MPVDADMGLIEHLIDDIDQSPGSGSGHTAHIRPKS